MFEKQKLCTIPRKEVCNGIGDVGLAYIYQEDWSTQSMESTLKTAGLGRINSEPFSLKERICQLAELRKILELHLFLIFKFEKIFIEV